jgi:hypothetical protein
MTDEVKPVVAPKTPKVTKPKPVETDLPEGAVRLLTGGVYIPS